MLRLRDSLGLKAGSDSFESSPALTGLHRKLHSRTTKNNDPILNMNINEPSQIEPLKTK